MVAELLTHPNGTDVGVKRSDHQFLLDAGYCVCLLGEALDVLVKSLTRVLLEGVEVPRNPRALISALESLQKLLLQGPPRPDGVLGKVEKPSLGISLQASMNQLVMIISSAPATVAAKEYM